MLFGLPGAYTPSCHYIHMPGVLDEVDALRRAGIDTVACTAVNDVFVLDVWAEATGAKGRVLFLGDGNADFVTATGLELDATGLGLGLRSRRYAMWAGTAMSRRSRSRRTPPSPKSPPPMPC